MAFSSKNTALIMTQNPSRWTDKHLKFALKFRIGAVAEHLWRWLLTLPKVFDEKIEFTIKEFQQYVKKQRGVSHDFGWVRKQFNKLVFLRIIHIDKDFGHNTYRIELRHPEAVIPKKPAERNSHYHQVSLKKTTSNDCNSEIGISSSSNSSIDTIYTDSLGSESSSKNNKDSREHQPADIQEQKRRLLIIRLCAKYGILFNPNKATTDELYKYSLEEIGESLELYKHRSKSSKIDNPPGWLITCLRFRYFDDCYYSYDSFITDMEEVFKNISDLEDDCILDYKKSFTQ